MSSRYNAEQERAEGRMTHDDIERTMSFGPGKDRVALSQAVTDVLRLSDEGFRLFERTKRGNRYRMPAGFADMLGIEISETTDNSFAAPTTELATVHDTLSGIVRYVGESALPPEAIAPDILAELKADYEEPQPQPQIVPHTEPLEPVPVLAHAA